MPNAFTVDPFDASRYLGTTCSVGPTQVSVTLTRSAAAKPAVRRVASEALGEVGDFVVVDASPVGVFGRISNVSLPERERLSMEADSGELKSSPYPVGQVQLLQPFLTLAGAALILGEALDMANFLFAFAVIAVVMIGRRTAVKR